MGEHTAVLQDSETFEVSLDITLRARRQLDKMHGPLRELATVALSSFAARIGNYFSEEIPGISFVGRTKEEIFTIEFEIFGPCKAIIHYITIDMAPIDESKGFFCISRKNKSIFLTTPSSSSVVSQMFEILHVYEKGVDRTYCYRENIFDILSSFKDEDIRSVFRGPSTMPCQFRNQSEMAAEFSGFLTDRFARRFAAPTVHDNSYLVYLPWLTSKTNRHVVNDGRSAALQLVQFSRQRFNVVISPHCSD